MLATEQTTRRLYDRDTGATIGQLSAPVRIEDLRPGDVVWDEVNDEPAVFGGWFRGSYLLALQGVGHFCAWPGSVWRRVTWAYPPVPQRPTTEAERTFTYEPGFTSATDPATVAHLRPGDAIHVTGWHNGKRDHKYTTRITQVQRDEYGLYFDTEPVACPNGSGWWSNQASTVTDIIRPV